MSTPPWGPRPTHAEVSAHRERGDRWLARWTGDTTGTPSPGLRGFAHFDLPDGRVLDPHAHPDAEVDGYPIDADRHEFAPMRSSDGAYVERITGPEAEDAFWREDARSLYARGRCSVCRKLCRRVLSGEGATYRIHKRCTPKVAAVGANETKENER